MGHDLDHMAVRAATVSRRQTTVLFCDLVGSTELAQSLDPEEWHELLATYRALVQQVVLRFDGHVARTTGDGIDVYFGYPQAGEDDAVRAIHAGLGIVDSLTAFNAQQGASSTPLQARVGIATGWLAVDMHDPSATAGATLNLAARIQSVAEPGWVLVSAGTRRVAGEQFEYESLGSQRFKGFETPVPVARVLAAGALNSRSAWRWRGQHEPPVGRALELAWLREHGCLAQAVGCRPFGILLSAEPGMGKSRLAHAFATSLQSEDVQVLHLQCSPFHGHTPFYPFLEHLRQTAGCGPQDDAASQWRKVELQLQAAGVDPAHDLQVVAALMGLLPENAALPGLPPMAQHQMAQAILMRYLIACAQAGHEATAESASEAGAAAGRWLLLFEDLHWIDPSSLAMLAVLWQQAPAHGLGLLLTARPQVTPASLGLANLEVLELAGLAEEAALALVQRCLGDTDLPEGRVQAIVAKADGVPLFLEELTRMVLDEHHHAQSAPALQNRPARAIPDTLMDLLMARLDRLGECKWLAQVAAVIGHRCSVSMLQVVSQLSATAFAQDLQVLLHSSLLERQDGLVPQMVFKHALVADTAYESIPLRLRASMHGRVADHLLSEAQAHGSGPWAEIARHLTRAGRALQAARTWWRAGCDVLGHGAPREAEAHFLAGLEALGAQPEGRERELAQLALLSALGPTTMVLMGPGAPAFGELQQQAHALCMRLSEQADAPPEVARQHFPITYGLSLYHWGRAELAQAHELALFLRQQAEADPTPERLMAAHNMAGMVAFHRGDAPAAREHLMQSVALYEPERDQALYPVYMMDFGVFGRFYLALSCMACGQADQASLHAQDSHALALQLAQPHSLGFSMLAQMIVACMREDVPTAKAWAERCVDFSSEFGFPEFVAMGRVVRGWAWVCEGRAPEGLAEIEHGIAQWAATGFANWQTWFATLHAKAWRALCQPAEALRVIDQQLQRLSTHGEVQFHSHLLAEREQALAVLAAL